MKKNLIIFTLVILFLVTACNRAEYDTPVDKNSRYGFDTNSINSVETNIVNSPSEVEGTVSNTAVEGSEVFVPPPHADYAPNQTVSETDKARFVGKDAVKLWVWNRRGSTKLFLAEGESINSEQLGVTLEVNSIGTSEGGKIFLVLNGKPLPILSERQEIKVGETYVFVSNILLNEYGE